MTTTTHARFLVEPHFKSYDGSFKVGDESGSFSGRTYGVQLGYLGDYFMAGINIENGQYTYDDNLTSDGDTEFKGGGIGTFLGFHFWDRWKLWTGYLNSTLEPTKDRDKRYFGQHASIGIGYRIWDGLMINFENFRNQFTQEENDTTGKTTGLDSNIKTSGRSLSLSYILAF